MSICNLLFLLIFSLTSWPLDTSLIAEVAQTLYLETLCIPISSLNANSASIKRLMLSFLILFFRKLSTPSLIGTLTKLIFLTSTMLLFCETTLEIKSLTALEPISTAAYL